MKKTLIRCIVLIHSDWKKDIRLYHENEKLYVRYVEKYYDKVSKTIVDFGDEEPENVTKAKNYIKNIL
jgi:hypothetical protein